MAWIGRITYKEKWLQELWLNPRKKKDSAKVDEEYKGRTFGRVTKELEEELLKVNYITRLENPYYI